MIKTIDIQKTIDFKFWDRIATFEDVKDIEGIKENENAFYNEETKARYFTFDAVEKIQKAYDDGNITFRVPTIEERKDAIDITGNFKALRNKLQLPYNGYSRHTDERLNVGNSSALWSSSPFNDHTACFMSFDADGDGYGLWSNQRNARSLVFLQD